MIKDPATGKILELRCTYDPETKGGWSKDGRKVKGTLHWVSAAHALKAEVRLYDHLFSKEDPTESDEGKDWKHYLNPDSLKILDHCLIEPTLAAAKPGERFQFLRQGYFCADDKDSNPDHLVFNRTVTLRDTWAKILKKESGNK